MSDATDRHFERRRKVLDEHRAIAWDYDGTLYRGVNSSFFWRYIEATPNTAHAIVTFRGVEQTSDLDGWRGSIVCCPAGLWEAYKGAGIPAGSWFRAIDGTDAQRHAARLHCERRGIAPEHVTDFLMWKAKQAQRLGCTALVDDRPDLVMIGCEKNRIKFYDARSVVFGWPDKSLKNIGSFQPN